MALLLTRDSSTWIHDTDFSQQLKKVVLKTSADEKDSTTFQPPGGYRSRVGGLRDVEFSVDGFWDSAPDATAFAGLGVADRVITVSPEGAETKTAYLLQAGRFDYEAFGQVGEIVPFVFAMKGTNANGVVRGQMAINKATFSTTGAKGSGVNLGAVGASQFLYATLHAFAVGTTVTVTVQSDTSNAFAAPTTRATIGPITATGGNWMARIAGPITDTWYRFNVTIITGSFSLAGAIGVGS